MKKLIMSLAAAAIVASGFGAYKAYESYNVSADSLLKMNLNVLAQNETGGSEGGASYEYPDGFAFTRACGVRIKDGLFGTTCKVIVINCQGGGAGCNSSACPVHPAK